MSRILTSIRDKKLPLADEINHAKSSLAFRSAMDKLAETAELIVAR